MQLRGVQGPPAYDRHFGLGARASRAMPQHHNHWGGSLRAAVMDPRWSYDLGVFAVFLMPWGRLRHIQNFTSAVLRRVSVGKDRRSERALEMGCATTAWAASAIRDTSRAGCEAATRRPTNQPVAYHSLQRFGSRSRLPVDALVPSFLPFTRCGNAAACCPASGG
jgi:hypothetical protein